MNCVPGSSVWKLTDFSGLYHLSWGQDSTASCTFVFILGHVPRGLYHHVHGIVHREYGIHYP